eukprot:TRINITY_DN7594_c1_g1_i1.p1 TRINITY_DN7594_c1_g1~~TRINITY_DN7594_c1_g1_i1.p1  ORF type:complete len:592 (+),score=164.93 TRINITY_DN7594_c1_g1_i1:82-1857(+)
MPVIRYDRGDRVPPLILSHLRDRGWQEYDEDVPRDEQPMWNLWWRNHRFTVSQLACPRYPHQRLNHFPRTGEITKKDTLLRNIRRMRGVFGQVCDILPTTFTLPGDYVKFCQDYATAREEAPDTCYICKPSDMSRGRKIFVFRDIGELTYDCSVVVQRYIADPLLMAGYKFDLRVYVLVTSFQPLRAYVYRNYLVRFATEKYDLGSLDNLFSHLTNSSINKTAPCYTVDKDVIGEGCKWDAPQFEAWLERVGVSMDVLWTRIETVVNVTLLSISPNIPSNPACFELYGFDLLLDESWKPWLLEVNLSPALHIDGAVDTRIKTPLVADVMSVLRIPEEPAEPLPAAPPAEAPPAHQPMYGRRASAGTAQHSRRDPSVGGRPERRGSSTAPVSARASSNPRRLSAVHAAPPPPQPQATLPTAADCTTAAGGGANAALRARRSASQQRLSEVKAKVSAGRSVRRACGSAGPALQRAEASLGSDTPLVDRPAGLFDLIFPFNDTTRQLAARLAKDGGQDKDGSMRGIIQEIKKMELPAYHKAKAFPKLHRDFMERLKVDPSLLSGLATFHRGCPPASAPPAAAAADGDAGDCAKE